MAVVIGALVLGLMDGVRQGSCGSAIFPDYFAGYCGPAHADVRNRLIIMAVLVAAAGVTLWLSSKVDRDRN